MVNIRSSGQVEIVFGTGDIIIACGMLESGKGIITLRNHKPRKIGSSSKKFKGLINVFDNKEIQTIITFSKVESIDVLIECLEETKKIMSSEI